MGRFAALMYHRVTTPEYPVTDDEEARYAVGLENFRGQMARLAQTQRRGISMADAHEMLCAGTPVSDRSVVLTFDDGNRSDYDLVCPVLRELGFNATFYICGNRVDASGGLTGREIRTMADDGFHLAAHGMTHRFLNTLTEAEEMEELRASAALVGRLTGSSVDHFAPPGGRYTRRSLSLLRDLGYRAVATSDFGFNRGDKPQFVYRRIPITRHTSVSDFDRYVSGRPVSVWRESTRARVLGATRQVLGEARYARIRGAASRNEMG